MKQTFLFNPNRFTSRKYIFILLLVLLLSTLGGFSSYASDAEIEVDEEYATTEFVYFYTQGCVDCEAVSKFMDKMDDVYIVEHNGQQVKSKISILKIDIGPDEGFETLYAFYDYYEVPEDRRFVPSIFIGDTHFMSAEEIERELIDAIESGKGLVEDSVTAESIDTSNTSISLSGKSVAGVVVTGLLNGLNPCSISMILFLFSLLLAKDVNVLKLGFAFILGKFITYVLLGSVFYNLLLTFNIDWLNSIIKVILIVLFLGLSLMNFLDFIAAKNENYGKIKMQLPAKLRKVNHKIIEKITSVKNQKKLLLMCFVIGVVISVGEFLCTGQIYLATIVYVLQNSEAFNIRSFMYLVLYSFMFTIPLIAITFAVHKSKSYFNLTELVRGKLHIIKLMNALFFLLFVVLVIFFF